MQILTCLQRYPTLIFTLSSLHHCNTTHRWDHVLLSRQPESAAIETFEPYYDSLTCHLHADTTKGRKWWKEQANVQVKRLTLVMKFDALQVPAGLNHCSRQWPRETRSPPSIQTHHSEMKTATTQRVRQWHCSLHLNSSTIRLHDSQINACTINTPYVPWQHTLPSLNTQALTTEIALLIKFMREQARAKFATREPTYAILPSLLLSIQWLKNLTVLKPSQPSPDLHSHTTHYNSGTIPGPAPAAVPQKYQHLQEQTPSCQSIITSHRAVGGGAGGRMSTAIVKDKINTLSMREAHSLQFYPSGSAANCFSCSWSDGALLCCHITVLMRTKADYNHNAWLPYLWSWHQCQNSSQC